MAITEATNNEDRKVSLSSQPGNLTPIMTTYSSSKDDFEVRIGFFNRTQNTRLTYE
jgi:hypothetical protein